jgi:Holliday junction DNA helicase RuvA
VIGWLRGRVVARSGGDEVVLEVGGVGYRVHVTPAVAAAAMGSNGTGGELELHVHTHVREDAIVLYGFATAEERRCFEALLGAHGVGPSLAMAVLGVLPPGELARAVADEDLDSLCAVPGVGRKTAARLLLDLRSRLEGPELVQPGPPRDGGERGGPRAEVRAALAELGYGAEEIRRALAEVPGDSSTEEMLRQALRELAGARAGR